MYRVFPSADEVTQPTNPSMPSIGRRPRPSAPTRNALPCPVVLSANASSDPSLAHSRVVRRPEEASFNGWLPSIPEIHNSILLGPRILTYIKCFTSGAIVGWVAFSETMSTDVLLRGW